MLRKRLVGIILAMVMMVSLFGSFAANAAAPETNIARGKSTTTSSTVNKNASAVTDGSLDATFTWYVDGANNPTPGNYWVQIDLGNEYVVNRVKLYGHQTSGTIVFLNYLAIQGSNDANFTTYETIAETGAHNQPKATFEAVLPTSKEYRYIRVVSNSPSGTINNQISEIEVYGAEKVTQAQIPADRNIAKGKKIDSNSSGLYYSESLINGVYNDSSAANFNHNVENFVVVDLDGYYKLDYIAARNSMRGSTQRTNTLNAMKFFVSVDKSAWTEIASTRTEADSKSDVRVGCVTDKTTEYRYVKMLIEATDTANDWCTMSELEVYAYVPAQDTSGNGNIALNKTVIWHSSVADNATVSNFATAHLLTDGNENTYAYALDHTTRKNAFLIIDLQNSYDIGKIALILDKASYNYSGNGSVKVSLYNNPSDIKVVYNPVSFENKDVFITIPETANYRYVCIQPETETKIAECLVYAKNDAYRPRITDVVKDGTAITAFKAYSDRTTNKNSKIIVAVYENDVLDNVVIGDVEFSLDSTERTYNLTSPVTVDAGKTVKLFVFNNMNTIVPVMEAYPQSN